MWQTEHMIIVSSAACVNIEQIAVCVCVCLCLCVQPVHMCSVVCVYVCVCVYVVGCTCSA